MNFQIALKTLLFLGTSTFLATASDAAADSDANAKFYAAMVRNNVERRLKRQSIIGVEKERPHPTLRRNLGDDDDDDSGGGIDLVSKFGLHSDYKWVEGEWKECLRTTLMTFNGKPAEKHVVEERECRLTTFGSVEAIGKEGGPNSQIFLMDIYILNHCWFHDLGGEGEEPCPNDRIEGDPRGDGNVIVRYAMKGIGSFGGDGNKIKFTSDHSYLKDENGEWKINFNRAKLENMDNMICEKKGEGMICDWYIDEYRTGDKPEDGCRLKKGSNKGQCVFNKTKNKCKKNGKGEWVKKDDENPCFLKTVDGFNYQSFGTYYLAKSAAACQCDGEAPSPTDPPGDEDCPSRAGCYKGGRCEGSHGCCDCDITDEVDCTDGIFQTGGCESVCFGDPCKSN